MWLIAGASGQLGRCLQEELSEQNIKFIAATRKDFDLKDSGSVTQFFSTNAFNTIINCAAWTAVDDAEDRESEALKVNFEGPRNLAICAKEFSARLIHISTDYVFSGDGKTPYSVTTPTSPVNAYGRTKLQGEKAVLEIGAGYFPIIRTAWLYSRHGKNFAKNMASRAVQKLPVRVVDDQIGQPTSAKDLARFIVQVAKHESPPSIIHGTNSGQASWFDFARAIYDLAGASVSLVTPVSSKEFPTRAVRPSFSVLDHSELKQSSIEEMRNWSQALLDEIPEILRHVRNELQ